MESNEKGFCGDISSKRKAQENVGPLLNGAGDLLMKDIKKAEIIHVVFTVAFSGGTCLSESQDPEASERFWNKEDLPVSRG